MERIEMEYKERKRAKKIQFKAALITTPRALALAGAYAERLMATPSLDSDNLGLYVENIMGGARTGYPSSPLCL